MKSDLITHKRNKKTFMSILPAVSMPKIKSKKYKKWRRNPVKCHTKTKSTEDMQQDAIFTDRDKLIERNIIEYFERKEAYKNPSTTVGNNTEISTKSTSSIWNNKSKHQFHQIFNLNQIQEEAVRNQNIY